MLDELSKYEDNDHFLFKEEDELSKVCNAPTDKGGVYIVYALERGEVRLVYIGMSGQKNSDGTIKLRVSGLGGMKDRIVNGLQFGKVARKKSWSKQMVKEGIDALDVYWYVTYSDKHQDFPRDVERKLINIHRETHGVLPRWNKKS
jgi:hypothetical protein